VGEEEALRVGEGVLPADPDTVPVIDCVALGDIVPDPVCVWEGLEEDVMEPVKEGVKEGVCVCS